MTTAIPAQIILVLPDFPRNALPELGDRDVCMETLEIAADSKSLKGTALLRNIAFEKRLSIRFTMDDWQTVSEVTGEWTSTLVGGTVDRWSFNIKLADLLAHIEDKKMYIALRYNVGWQEVWDNNYGKNYLAEFRKQAARSQAVVGGARAARHEWSVTNPGQANERMADLRRELDRLVAQDMSDDFGPSDELILNTKDSKNFRFNNPRFIGGEAVPLALAPKESSFSSRYDFGASLKKSATHRNSPQSSHAILDNPYFASPASVAAAQEATSNWRQGGSVPPVASVISSLATSSPSTYPVTSMSAPVTSVPSSLLSSPPPSINTTAALSTRLLEHTRQQSTPEMQKSPLYADDVALLSTNVSFAPPAAGLSELAEAPPASFTGNRYFERTEKNGVVITDYAHPNQFSFPNSLVAPFSPASTAGSVTSESSGGFDESAATVRGISPPPSPLSDLPATDSDSLLGDLTPRPDSAFPVGPGGVLVGGAPLSRQLDGAVKSAAIVRGGSNDSSNGSGNPSFDGSNPYSFASARKSKQLDDHDLLESVKFSWLTDLGSGASTPTSLEDRRSEDSPIARSTSPSDLLSPSPSSASTDTSVSTPQSPEQSPPLRLYSPYIGNGNVGAEKGSVTMDMTSPARPDVGSDTYFNFVHRYCWGSGEPPAPSSASTHNAAADGSSALGLANLHVPLSFDRFASPGSTNSSASSTSTTPRRGTPTPSSLSTSTSISSAASLNSCSFLLSSTSPHGSRTPSPTLGSPNVETVARMNGEGYLAGPPAVRI